MVPAQPGEAVAVPAQARRRVEVRALDEDRLAARVEVDGGDRVHGLVRGVGVVLTDADQPAAAVDHAVGVAQAVVVRHGRRRPAPIDAVEALIGEVREVDDAVEYREVAAAVLVNAGPSVERRWRHVLDVAVRPAPDDHVASSLRRPALDPVDVLAVDDDLAEAHGARDDEVGRDRRPPRAVRRLVRRRHPALPASVPKRGITSSMKDCAPPSLSAAG